MWQTHDIKYKTTKYGIKDSSAYVISEMFVQNFEILGFSCQYFVTFAILDPNRLVFSLEPNLDRCLKRQLSYSSWKLPVQDLLFTTPLKCPLGCALYQIAYKFECCSQ